jgi:CRISPR/Cas system-associated exonuclease Cas4 (RecB family)
VAKPISRSKVELFLSCPRCFWLDQVAKVAQPPGFPFNLNNAVDQLLKNEFDRYRGAGVVPPRLAREGLCYTPAPHPDLSTWRQNFKGVRVVDAATGLTVFGAIDDLWIDAQGTHYVVDYKATSKNDEVTLDAPWQISYKRQVEFYQWLMRRRGLKISNTAWFVYANGMRGDEPFDDILRFRTRLLAYEGNDAWVQPALVGVAQCLQLPHPPKPAPDCEYCRYVAGAAAFS